MKPIGELANICGCIPVWSYLKQGGALLALLLSFAALEYAIRKAQGNHEGLKLNETYKLMICVDVIVMVKM
jgi:hypothetical protein